LANIVTFLTWLTVLSVAFIWIGRLKKFRQNQEALDEENSYGARRRKPNHAWLSRLVLPVRLGLALTIFGSIVGTSIFYVDKFETGHMIKRLSGGEMPAGRIIATNGENGPQAVIYGPGLHFSLGINLYADIEKLPAVDIPPDHYGLVTAIDGRTLPEDVVIAPPLFGTSIAPSASGSEPSGTINLFDAASFLDREKGGYKGVQATVLKPGLHRINLYLFNVKVVRADGSGFLYSRNGRTPLEGTRNTPTTITQIPTGFVGVVKSNIKEDWRSKDDCRRGQKEAKLGEIQAVLVPDGCKGVWQATFEPGAYYFNNAVYEVSQIESRAVRWVYKGGFERCEIALTVNAAGQFSQNRQCSTESYDPATNADMAITVKVEGWNIPVELRVLMQVRPEDAPSVVAAVGSIDQIEDRIITPAIRSIVRNIGGGIYAAPLLDKNGAAMLDADGNPVIGRRPARALDFQEYRSYLEAAFEKAIMTEAKRAGITILEVKIGEPGIPPELLVARRREQLSEQLKLSFMREQEAQEQRIKAENAKALADQQPVLVRADIDEQASQRRQRARRNDGEGEKLYLEQVAAGQRAQAQVLGEDRVLYLQMMQSVLKALTDKPELANLVPDPQILVLGGGSAENATAIGGGLLADKLGGLLNDAGRK